jgi:hypothetical protein
VFFFSFCLFSFGLFFLFLFFLFFLNFFILSGSYANTLGEFDCVIVVSSARTRESDIALVQQAVKKGVKKVFIVRNKVDLDIESRRRRIGESEGQAMEGVRTTIEENLRPQLQQVGAGDCELFLVSSHETRWAVGDKYDSKKLFAKLNM